VEIAGPVRRWLEIVEYLAFAVASDAPDAVIARLREYPLVTAAADGTVRLADGLRCELVIAPLAKFGWALIRATGSPAHVERLEQRAGGVVPDGAEEADVYRALGLAPIPPEVRDGDDELAIDWSDLVELADVTTAVHCHTTYSDGKDSILAMAEAAQAQGMRAITITDHSAAATYAGGLDAERLRA